LRSDPTHARTHTRTHTHDFFLNAFARFWEGEPGVMKSLSEGGVGFRPDLLRPMGRYRRFAAPSPHPWADENGAEF
jgi:hypothetical protein